ncbi:uncharacterized protein LOC131854567 [Achroia grisella]|uniref:uncharacterized protein LOC131854567 n=1 Tax=Achroia grisella TaxID=688607 RepID=UPI0027D25BEB|nr:uncharacterized protein LOC131854567 [Achroia grisella]
MNHNSAAFLMTYDPRRIEEHTDSSDFEELAAPVNFNGISTIVCKKIARKRPKMKKNFNHQGNSQSYNKEYTGDNDGYNLCRQQQYKSNINISEVKIRCNRNSIHNLCYGNILLNNKGDHYNYKEVKQIKSKCSLMRHKLIPCFSNIFSRTNNSLKHMTTIEENRVKNTCKDTGCQAYCALCKQKQLRKHYKQEQSYLVQPVYTVEGCIEPDAKIISYWPKQTGIPQATIKITRDICSNTSNSLTSLFVNNYDQMIPTKVQTFRTEHNAVEKGSRQVKKYRNNVNEQQCLRKQRYQIFSTPDEVQSRAIGSSTPYIVSPTQSVAISNSSAFWEYVFDKINKRYNIQNIDINKTSCSNNTSSQYCSKDCNKEIDSKNVPTFCSVKCDIGSPDSLFTCSIPPAESTINTRLFKNVPVVSSLSSLQDKKDTKPRHIQCKCFPDKNMPKIATETTSSPIPTNDINRSCLEPHDNITQQLAQNYNGEILCVHNPPCVLIHGCLNLPPSKVPTMPAWSMTQEKRSSFFQMYHRFKNLKKNSKQLTQYKTPLIEQQQYRIEENIKKGTQSVSNHDPPCEVVRRCYKPKYDSKLENSCVHVPMCQKVPECLLGNEELIVTSCQHRPKCIEVPVCRRNYLVLTAKDNVGTQVKPKMKMICRHVPPCILIPKCLGRLMNESYIPYDAIPGCGHQPMCELIPACCRKPSKMVSVYSQYPAPCRIV